MPTSRHNGGNGNDNAISIQKFSGNCPKSHRNELSYGNNSRGSSATKRNLVISTTNNGHKNPTINDYKIRHTHHGSQDHLQHTDRDFNGRFYSARHSTCAKEK